MKNNKQKLCDLTVPSGISVQPDPDMLQIIADPLEPERKHLALLIILFGFLFTLATLALIFSQAGKGYKIIYTIASSVLGIVTAILVFMFLMTIFGKVYVTVKNESVIIKMRLGLTLYKRIIGIADGYKIIHVHDNIDSEYSAIKIKGDEIAVFGTQLNKDQIQYIISAIVAYCPLKHIS